MNEDWQGIPNANLNQLAIDISEKLMFRLSKSKNPVKFLELGYRDSEPADIITPDLPTPAVLIKFVEIRPQTFESRGVTLVKKQNNRIVAELIFKAYAIIKANEKLEGRESQELAVSLASAINSEERFGHPVGPSQVMEIVSDGYVDFEEDLENDCKDSFVVWRVEWFHETLLGEIYTEGYCDDDFQINPQDIEEIVVSLDLHPHIKAEAIKGADILIYKNVNPRTGEKITDNYVLYGNPELITDDEGNLVRDGQGNVIRS